MALGKQSSSWTREGGPFDFLALAIFVTVVISGLFIVNSASRDYRVVGTPLPLKSMALPAFSAAEALPQQ